MTRQIGIEHNSCGSELARECVSTPDIDVSELPLSRASSLPQGIAVRPEPIFLSRRADSCQDYVTATALFKPANQRKREISAKA